MTKKKTSHFDKYDLLSCILLTVSFILFIFLFTEFKYVYGSSIDWESQHITIPEYFRQLFYQTHDLFPDFAPNLGNGQNIYNFAYYGLLSPIIFISYLFPFIKMMDFIIYSTIILVILASILFYFFLRKHRYSHLTSFIGSFALLFSTGLTFQSHRHIMFVNYMPFLILGLFGVDKKLQENQGWLLSLSVFLIIMTSYYYSISSILCLVIYGIYEYLELNKKITFKDFIIDGLKFLCPIVIAILSASILILPTIYVLLTSRGATISQTNIGQLLIPKLTISNALYYHYGPGLTAIFIYGLVNLFTKDKAAKFLSVILTIILTCPILNYFLNGTMYLNSKIYIPMLPLMLIPIIKFIDDLFNKTYAYRYLFPITLIISLIIILCGEYALLYTIDFTLITIFIYAYYRTSHKYFLIIPLMIIPFSISYGKSLIDTRIEKSTISSYTDKLTNSIAYITDSDQSLYHISNNLASNRDVNNLFNNLHYYTNTLYSSTYNLGYNQFYYDTINNPIPCRNRVITSPSSNIMSLIFLNNKYLITNKLDLLGYNFYAEIDGEKIYQNANVLPFAYASSNLLNSTTFEQLSYPITSELLLTNIITEKSNNTNYTTHIVNQPYDLTKLNLQNLDYEIKDNYYLINVSEDTTITYPLDATFQNKIIFLTFDILESNSCDIGDSVITINAVENKLTCADWKYHNQNYNFSYVLAGKNQQELKITFSKGIYKITNIKMSTLDYDYLTNIPVDPFIPDENTSSANQINGNIDVTKDGYFATTIPYDEGFHILLDDEEIPYERVNTSFLGFPITSGHHTISITYKSPLKKMATIISTCGLILFLVTTYYEQRRKKLGK